MIAIPAGDMACFLRVSASNSAGNGPFSDTGVTPTPVSKQMIIIVLQRKAYWPLKFPIMNDVLLQIYLLHASPK